MQLRYVHATCRSHVFQTGFGGPPRRPRPQGQQQGPTGSFAGILHLLPILLLLFFTFMMQPSEPVSSTFHHAWMATWPEHWHCFGPRLKVCMLRVISYLPLRHTALCLT